MRYGDLGIKGNAKVECGSNQDDWKSAHGSRASGKKAEGDVMPSKRLRTTESVPGLFCNKRLTNQGLLLTSPKYRRQKEF